MKVKLTQALVDKALEPGHYTHADLKGFVLVVKPAAKLFKIRYTYDWAQRWLTIGNAQELTLAQAVEIAKDKFHRLRQGLDPRGDRVAPMSEAVLEWFVDHRLHLVPKSVENYRYVIDLHILPALGKIDVKAVSPQHVRKLHSSMQATKTAANRTVSVLSTFFKWCEEVGYRDVNTNPCTYVKRYKEGKRERYLSNEELDRLLDVLAGWRDQAVADIVRLLILTGARKTEVSELRWEWIKIKDGVIRYPDSKTGATTRFLSAPALQLLQRRGLSSKTKGKVFNVVDRTLYYQWYKIIDAAGITDLRIHDLRHHFASTAVGLGLSLPMVGKLLGHKSAATTERYAHLMVDPMKQATERVAESLSQQAGDDPPDNVVEISGYRW